MEKLRLPQAVQMTCKRCHRVWVSKIFNEHCCGHCRRDSGHSSKCEARGKGRSETPRCQKPLLSIASPVTKSRSTNASSKARTYRCFSDHVLEPDRVLSLMKPSIFGTHTLHTVRERYPSLCSSHAAMGGVMPSSCATDLQPWVLGLSAR